MMQNDMHDVQLACQNALKHTDKPFYYACLFAPAKLRKHFFALFAFAAEIAATRSRISEPMPGEIRLQWWRDVLEGQRAGEAEANPLSAGLLAMLAETGLGAGPLVRLIEARRFDLYDDPMGDLNQYEGYAGETHSILFQYMCLMSDERAGDKVVDASGHAGVALALTRHMLDFRLHSQRGQIFLPSQIWEMAGVTPELFFKDVAAQAPKLVEKAHELAEQHLEQARAVIARLDRPFKQHFRILAVVEAQLNNLKSQRFDVLRAAPMSDLKVLWQLWRGV